MGTTLEQADPTNDGEVTGNPTADGGNAPVAAARWGPSCGWCDFIWEHPIHGASTQGAPSGELV